MEYAEALSDKIPPMKKKKAELMHMMLSKAENGGVIAEHRMSEFNGKEPKFAFGKGEGKKLAAHIKEHMGMEMPGSMATDETEPEA